MSKEQTRNTNYCLCVGFCMQNDIWEDKPMPHHLIIRMAVVGCKGTPICQGTNKIITKKKPLSMKKKLNAIAQELFGVDYDQLGIVGKWDVEDVYKKRNNG